MRSQYVFNYCWKDFPISSNHSSKSTDWLSEFQVLIFLEVIKASELVTRYLQQRKVIYLCFKVEKVFIRTSVFELEKIWHSLKMEQRSSVAAFCSCKVCILIFQKEKTTSGSIYNANKIGPRTEPWGTPQETIDTVGQVNEKKSTSSHLCCHFLIKIKSNIREKKWRRKK